MSLKQIDQCGAEIHVKIISEYPELIKGSEAISSYVSNKVSDWQRQTQQNLLQNFPYDQNESSLACWKNIVESGLQSVENFGHSTQNFLALCKEAKRPANEVFWHKQLDQHQHASNKTQRDLPINAQLLLNEWQKATDEIRTEWELDQLQVFREQLLKQLEDFLQHLQELHDQLESMGLEPGILLDLSKGKLSEQDIKQFKRWAKYMAENQGVKSLCDMLGKMRQIELSEKIERVQVTRVLSVPKPDLNSREEIVGIRLGRDIEYALPSELALLSDPDTSLLFDLKFVESRLMCFEMQGIVPVLEYHDFEEDVQVQEQEKQGPMVLCVDTSGSMHGMPETIAKAVVLYMASKARADKRPCYLINFSTGIQTLDLGESMGMESLIRFLQMSFYGGTDVAPALRHALDVMKKDDYLKSDLLIISDFIMGHLPANLLKQIELQREGGNKFYSLVVGSSFMSDRIKTLFDQEWVFNPATSHIHELVNFNENISQRSD